MDNRYMCEKGVHYFVPNPCSLLVYCFSICTFQAHFEEIFNQSVKQAFTHSRSQSDGLNLAAFRPFSFKNNFFVRLG